MLAVHEATQQAFNTCESSEECEKVLRIMRKVIGLVDNRSSIDH